MWIGRRVLVRNTISNFQNLRVVEFNFKTNLFKLNRSDFPNLDFQLTIWIMAFLLSITRSLKCGLARTSRPPR